MQKTDLELTRRRFLAASGGTAFVLTATAVLKPSEAWGYEVKALSPETFRSLIQIARDIYPHDRLADRYYAVAVKAHDDQAVEDAAVKAMIEEGVAELDALAEANHSAPYAEVGWEADRVTLLLHVQNGPFFQTVRGNLVTGLYNNQEVWPIFGYEGESASKGGYISRGFDDIDWL